jgi:hypothetical protein
VRKPQQQSSTPRALLVAALQLALVAGVGGAAWGVYGRLPRVGGEGEGAAGSAAQTALRIVLRRSDASPSQLAVQLYSVDVAAARREFEDERRYGQRFEDFVSRRMGARKPVSARLDAAGQAVVTVPHGRWWVHATLPGAPEITWRLPVNVAGREQTVELNETNALTRTKTF